MQTHSTGSKEMLERSGIDAATVLECTTDGVILVNRDWCLIYMNASAKALIGSDPNLVGQYFWHAFPHCGGSDFERVCRRVMNDRVPERCEGFSPSVSRWFENGIYPCSEGIAVYFRDTTAARRQAEALLASEEQARQQLAELEGIYAQAPVGLAVISTDGQFLRVNERLAAMHNLPVSAHIGKSFYEVFPAHAEALTKLVRKIVETGEPLHDVLVESEPSPGVKRIGLGQWLPQKDAAGTIVCINIVVEDISHRVKIEHELRDRNAELEAVLDAVPAAVFIAHDRDCRTMTVNPAAIAELRLAPGANASKTAPVGEVPEHFRLMKDGVEIPFTELPVQYAAATGQSVRGFEMDMVFDNGDVEHIHGNAAPLHDDQGNLRGSVGAFVNITSIVKARRQAVHEAAREAEKIRERLRAKREFIEAVLASATDGIFCIDRDQRLTIWNPAMERISGLGAAQVIGRVVIEAFPFLIGTDAETAFRDVVTGRPGAVRNLRYEVPETGRNGYYDCDFAPIRDVGGAVSGAVCIVRDITERRAADEHLWQAQKMEAVGQLTSGIAHDFNNILMVVSGNLQLIERMAQGQAAIERHAKLALEATDRAARQTAQMLAFARQQKLDAGIVRLDDVVRRFQGVLEAAIGPTIALRIMSEPELARCAVDPVQFETSVLNLAINARDAMPKGGLLNIDLRNAAPEENAAIAAATRTEGPFVCVSVEDTGHGMSPDTVRRALEPFFTTKRKGKGSGLGLSMVYGFVKQSGGHVVIESALQMGTRIMIYLPIARSASA